MEGSSELSEALGIEFEENDRAGIVTLNRLSRLNALSREMFDALSEHYRRWAANPHIYGVLMQSAHPSVFSSGGDLKTLNAWLEQGDYDAIRDFYRAAYTQVWTLERFIRPNVPVIDGLLLGGGIGITLYGTHCVAGENFRMAMPQTGIGFLPDIGGTYFLSRLPYKLGLYLALTGRSLGRADAYWFRLVSHCIPASHFSVIKDALSDNHPIDRLLDGLHRDPGEGELARMLPAINRLFAGSSVEAILADLDREEGEHRIWSRGVAADIRAKSPTSLKIGFEQMRRGRSLELRDALRLEYRLASRIITTHDYREGISARIAGKGRQPNWRPATLAEVDDAPILQLFAASGEPELELPVPQKP